MAFSLAAVVLLCLFLDWLLSKARIPALIGMLFVGVLFWTGGPELFGSFLACCGIRSAYDCIDRHPASFRIGAFARKSA